MKFTEKTSAYRLKSARTFGVVAISVCTALISLTPSIAQASQSPTSSKAQDELSTFLSFYDVFLNPCFKNLNSIFVKAGKDDLFDEKIDAEDLPGACNLATGLLRTLSEPTKAYPSLVKINSLTASWISEARILAAGIDDALLKKKTSASQNANFNDAFRTIGPTGGQILDSIRVAITVSKSHSIGKLPTIPTLKQMLKEDSADVPKG